MSYNSLSLPLTISSSSSHLSSFCWLRWGGPHFSPIHFISFYSVYVCLVGKNWEENWKRGERDEKLSICWKMLYVKRLWRKEREKKQVIRSLTGFNLVALLISAPSLPTLIILVLSDTCSLSPSAYSRLTQQLNQRRGRKRKNKIRWFS